MSECHLGAMEIVKVAAKPEDAAAVAKIKPNDALRCPLTKSAVTTAAWMNRSYGNADVAASLILSLEKCASSIAAGDPSHVENMLLAQADALDTVFHVLLQQAMPNMGKSPGVAEVYLRLALKAQANARATLDSLSRARTPQVGATFVGQANISGGPQIVHNVGQMLPTWGDEHFRPNELLERQHVQKMVGGTTGAAVASHTPLEAMAPLDWPEDHRGKKSG